MVKHMTTALSRGSTARVRRHRNRRLREPTNPLTRMAAHGAEGGRLLAS